MLDHNTHSIKNVETIFPFLKSDERIHYLDSAATSQKPQIVIDAITEAYIKYNANVHRGVYQLSEKATQKFEDCRMKVAKFLGQVSTEEVIFTSGTTESINLVARTWGEENIQAGDEILLTVCEHHSNIVPWQILAEKKKACLKFIPLNKDLRIDIQAAEKLINDKTKVLAFTHVSNVLGYISPVKKLIHLAKKHGAMTLIDGAQAVPHFDINVRELNCDFYCFSAHKMMGPTGIGVLYGKKDILNSMPPFLGGGDMISNVSTSGFKTNILPYKFEAGTPAIAQVLGLGAAIDFLMTLDREDILSHDRMLGEVALAGLKSNSHVKLYTTSGDDWVGIVSFSHLSIHPHDLAAFQDLHGVCIRAGHHCAEPLMNFLETPATIRLSPFMYNTRKDIELFLEALASAEKTFDIH